MSRSILLADDSVTIQKVVALTFDDSDFDLVGLNHGDEALAALRRAVPDMVIADVHMPGASGYELAAAVKAVSADTPVLLLIGTFEPFDEERFAASGADGYLLKPFESDELRERVEALLGAESGPSDGTEPALAGEEPAVDDESSLVTEVEEGVPSDGGGDGGGNGAVFALRPEDVDRIAHRVVELMSAEVVREVAHQVVPGVAETIVRRRLEELEREKE